MPTSNYLLVLIFHDLCIFLALPEEVTVAMAIVYSREGGLWVGGDWSLAKGV